MSDAGYEYWQDALEGRFGAITDMPECGFYRMKAAGDFWLPVAVWSSGTGTFFVQIGKEDPCSIDGVSNVPGSDDDRVRETWLRCAKYPVSEEDYRHAIATGQWPGEAPAERGMGDNRAPDGYEALTEKLRDEASAAAAWLKGRKVESQADADRCEKWANDFLTWKKQAEADHKREKQPHLDEGRKVDAKYKKLIDLASSCARQLKAAVTPYLVARQEEKRQAASAAIARGDPAPVRADLKATTSGLSGRKVHLTTHAWAVVNDWDAAVAHFKDHPDVRALVQGLADKLAKVGAPVPWAEFKSEQRAA